MRDPAENARPISRLRLAWKVWACALLRPQTYRRINMFTGELIEKGELTGPDGGDKPRARTGRRQSCERMAL